MHVFLSFYLCIYSQQYTTIIHLIVYTYMNWNFLHYLGSTLAGTVEKEQVNRFLCMHL